MFKKLLLSTATLAVVSTASFAADLPSRRAPPVYVPPAPIPVFTWTGFYIGGNAGYAFDDHTSYTLTPNDALSAAALGAGAVTPFVRTNSNGFTGGGQIGYNFELSSLLGGLGGLGGFGGLGGLVGSGFVAGVEADAAYTDLRNNSAVPGAGGFNTLYASRTDFVGTVRGRIGYAFDRFLVFGTGGFAYGGVRNGVNVIDPVTGGADYSGGQDKIATGYAYGGGVEYALPTTSFLNVFNSSAVTLKAEFIHYDLGSNTVLTAGNGAFAGSSFSTRIHNDGNLARGGINFKFGSPVAAPVVARY